MRSAAATAYQLQLQLDVEELPSQHVLAPGTRIWAPSHEWMTSCSPALRCSANVTVVNFIFRLLPGRPTLFKR
jgi:hypothetical protein